MRLAELPGDANLKPDQISLLLPEGVRTMCLFNGLNLDGWTAGEGEKAEWKVEDRILRCAGKSERNMSRELPPGDFRLLLDWMKDKNSKEDTAPIALDGLGLPATIPGDAIRVEGWNRAEIKVGGGKVSVTVNGKVAIAERALPEQTISERRVLRLLNPGHPISFCNLMRIEVAAKRP
jgi:hypothetical protein